MYFLMNKNVEIGSFTLMHGEMGDTYDFKQIDDKTLPIGFEYIDAWLENRKASKHNAHLRKIMKDCGCDKIEGFINITHAASINDTFWVKSDKETITWEKVSFYRNQFDTTISKLAFEGLGLYGIKLSNTTPELSTDGSFRKCWMRDDSENIYLYKRGSNGARNAGLEPYCEVLASELAQKLLGKNAVKYELAKLHGEMASKCHLFTSEEYGYVPISRFKINHTSIPSLMEFYKKIGSEDMFRRMLVLDALTFNVDRHAGNYGVLVNNDTQFAVSMAPVFDLNLSMLPYIEKEDMEHIGDTLENYGPRIGDDFTRIGQIAVTSSIRQTLIGLKGFSFEFRGDERFTEERVKFMEVLVNKQIDALLCKDVLYTHDVFIPEHHIQKNQNDIQEKKQTANDILADALWRKYDFDSKFSSYDMEENNMILFLQSNPFAEVHLNLRNGIVSNYIDGKEISIYDKVINYPELISASKMASDAYEKEKQCIGNVKTNNLCL